MRYEPFDWYTTPHLYDVVFDTTTAAEASFLDAVVQRHGRVRRGKARALEVACGTGRLLGAMEERGYEVAGFDASEAMLEAARERCPDARLWCDTMQGFRDRRRYEVVFSLLSSFKYLPTDADAEAHLSRVADVLVEGGVFVLGVHTSDYGTVRRARERWVGEREGLQVVCNLQSWPPDPVSRTERVRSRLVVTDAAGRRGYETHWTFRTYDEDELDALLRREPRLEQVALYGFEHDVERPRRDLRDGRLDHVFVLRRRRA